MTVDERLAEKSSLIRRVASAFVRRTGFIEFDDAVQVVSLAAWELISDAAPGEPVEDGLIVTVGFGRLVDEMRSGRVTGVRSRMASPGHRQLPVSLNAHVGADGEKTEFVDLVSDKRPDAYEQADDRRQVAAALAVLSPRYRSIVVLHYYEGLRKHEIAELLGISGSRVDEIIRKAHMKMRPILAA